MSLSGTGPQLFMPFRQHSYLFLLPHPWTYGKEEYGEERAPKAAGTHHSWCLSARFRITCRFSFWIPRPVRKTASFWLPRAVFKDNWGETYSPRHPALCAASIRYSRYTKSYSDWSRVHNLGRTYCVREDWTTLRHHAGFILKCLIRRSSWFMRKPSTLWHRCLFRPQISTCSRGSEWGWNHLQTTWQHFSCTLLTGLWKSDKIPNVLPTDLFVVVLNMFHCRESL